MNVDSSIWEVRMRLRGARQVQSENKKTAASITGVSTAAEVAGAASGKAASGGISRFQRGLSGLRGVGSKVGSVVESGMLRAAGALETFASKADKLKSKGASLRSTGKSMAYSMTLPLVGLGYLAIKTAAAFDKSMAQVGTALEVGGKKLQVLRDLAMEMGAKTIFSANQAAEAMLELSKSGISSAQIRAGALASTMNLAATESLELGHTAEILGAAMNTFNIPAKESKRISDALAGGAMASSASVGGLARSLSQGGQSAAMYKLSVEETVGTLAAFAQNGIQASDAGTSFKTFLSRLNPVTKKSKELMKELGLNFFDTHGQMKKMPAIAGELQDKLKGMNDQQRNAALGVLFGSDAIRAANIVYKEGPKGIAKYIKATERRGSAERMANAQMKGLPGAIERLKGSLETAALAAGESFAPVIEDIAGGIEKVANLFTNLPTPMQRVIVGFLIFAAAAGPLVWIVGSLITVVGGLATAAGFLATALLFVAANPAVLLIVAVLAMGAALFYAYHQFAPFRAAVDAMSNALGGAANTVAYFLRFVTPLGAAAVFIVAHFNWIKNAIKNVGHFFASLPGKVSRINNIPQMVGRVVAKIIVFMMLLPVKVPIFIVQMGIKMAGALLNIAPKVWSAAGKVAEAIVKGIKSKAPAIWGWVKTLPGKFASAVASIASSLASVGADIAKEIANGLKNELMSLLPGPVKDALGAAGGVAGDVGGFLGFASGTSFAPGGWSLVGERGPELIDLPRGSRVLSTTTTGPILRGDREPNNRGRGSRPITRPQVRGGGSSAALDLPSGGGTFVLHATIINELDGKEISRNTTKHALDAEARS